MADSGKTAYRDPPEPCPDCEARLEALEQMLPYTERGDRTCPECGSNDWVWWAAVCEGGGEKLNNRKRLFRKQTLAATCHLEDPPKHFHFRCSSCSTMWMMLSKSESA